MLEINNIYNIDCRTAINDIDDESVDILMTDIPYNISQNKTICQGSERTEHPTQKRLDIAVDMVTQSAQEGDLLLDLFVGSGTFLEAAYKCGLNYIGFENDEKWYKIATDRLNVVKSQLDFFRWEI